MAYHSLGLGGILSFTAGPAVKGMSVASRALGNLKARAHGVAIGMRKIGSGLASLGKASIVMGAGMGFGAKQAIDFEHQMGAVGAVTKASGKELKQYTDFAQKLGIETAYSATQSAQAMEVLGKAGLTGKKLMDATKGTTDLAAAAGENIASAADVLTTSLFSMGLGMDQSKRAANVLAMTSVETKADVIGLGESFQYAGGFAKNMNMSLETTAATMGLLAQQSIKGSAAGTGLSALFRHLQGSSRQSMRLMKQLGINIDQFGGDLSKLPAIITHVSERLDRSYVTPLQKGRAITKIFGKQGAKIFLALAGAGGKALDDLTKKLEKSGIAFKDKFGKPIGAAAFMAQKRLDTVKGATTLLKSSLESFSIMVMKGFLPSFKTRIQKVTASFNNMLFTMRALDKDDSLRNQQALIKKYGNTTVQMALGVRDALKLVKDSWKFIGDQIKKVGKIFGKTIGKDSIRKVTKLVLGLSMLAATIAPIFAGLMGLKFAFGMIWQIGAGAFIALKAAMLPVVAIAAVIGGAWLLLRRDGESLVETFTRVAKTIVSMAQNFWSAWGQQIKAFFWSVVSIFRQIGQIFMMVIPPILNLVWSMIQALRPALTAFIGFVFTLVRAWLTIIQAVVNAYRTIAAFIVTLINYLKPVIMDVVNMISGVLETVFQIAGEIVAAIVNIISFMMSLMGKILEALKPVFQLFSKIAKKASELGKIIGATVVVALKLAWNLIKAIFGVVMKLKPAFAAIVGVVSLLVKMIVKAASVLFNVLMWPLKKLAQGLGWVVRQVAKIAKYIPGLSSKWIHKLADALEDFAGVKKGVVVKEVTLAQRAGLTDVGVGVVKPEGYWRARRAAEKEEAKYGEAERKIEIADKRKISVNARTSIDGRCVAAASSRHQVELNERAGYGTTPWQRRAVIARAGSTTPKRAQ